MGLDYTKGRSMIDKEKCNNPSCLFAGERIPKGRMSMQRAWFSFLCRWERPANVRMQVSWAHTAVSICNPGIHKAGAGGSLAQDSRGVWGELAFSNRN